jgi:hypothetical protein
MRKMTSDERFGDLERITQEMTKYHETSSLMQQHIADDALLELVPDTWGEALALYPWIENYCVAHAWDNRTRQENLVWLACAHRCYRRWLLEHKE